MLTKARAGLFVSLIALQALFALPAQASSLAVMNSNILALFQAVGAPNQCVSYTYDKNGNILVRANQTYGSQATWGSSTFGCFSWAGA